MTGQVSWEVLFWVIGIVAVAGGTVAGFLFWVWRIVEAIKREAREALRERDTGAQLEKERAKLVEDRLRADMADFRQHVGETFATKDGVNDGLERVETAVKEIASQFRESIGGLTSRIDRLLETQAAQHPAPRATRPRS